MTRSKKLPLALLLIAALVSIDQWTKGMAVEFLKDKAAVPLIPGWLELQYSENRGAAFGLLQDGRIFFLIVTAAVLAAMAWFFVRIPEKKRYLPIMILLPIIAGGAIGNMIDRLMNGYVVDFIYLSVINFPIFNLADIFVSWSAVLLILFMIFKYKDEDIKELFGK
ncbi:MAG: signal peptidase II [Lachnospiraceae bacterium]|nr:signal peptidase II [Lachnospiraceae bacterium]